MRRLRWAAPALLAAILLAFGIYSQAGAQPATQTVVASGIPVTPVNGFADLDGTGTNQGVVGISCGPAFPLGGAVIPGIVITHLEADRTRLRIQQSGGNNASVNLVPVEINCAAEVETGAAASQLKRLSSR